MCWINQWLLTSEILYEITINHNDLWNSWIKPDGKKFHSSPDLPNHTIKQSLKMRQPPHPCYVPELISKEATPFSVIGSLLHLLKVYNYWYCSSTQEGRRGQCGIVFCEIKFPEEGVVLGAMHLYLYVLALLCTFLVEKGWQILHVT